MMQLFSSGQEVERPSKFDIARRLLRDVLREEPHAYFLWSGGRWVYVDIDGIMLRANQLLKNTGRPQLTGKEEWIA